MNVTSDRIGAVQWYYDRGNGLSETEMVSANVKTGDNDIEFRFPTGVYTFLRFDPMNSNGHLRVNRMEWDVLPGSTVPGNRDALQPLGNIDRVERHGDAIDIYPAAGSPDPQMSLPVTAPLSWTVSMQPVSTDVLKALGGAIVILAALFVVWRYLTMYRLVVVGMTIASILIFAMAWISTTKGSIHPDEHSHYFAYQYFESHWLPPAVTDPATIPSTSVWGFSYLFELDVVYDVAAQATAGLRHWVADDLFAARMFQFALWTILLTMAVLRRSWRWALCVTLISPQLWYIFSYLNADALPFFFSMIVACLITDETSGLNRFLREGNWRRAAVWIAALCLGGVLVSKRNYLPIFPVFLVWLAILHLRLTAAVTAPLLGSLLVFGAAIFFADVPALNSLATPLQCAALGVAGIAVASAIISRYRDRTSRAVLLRLTAFAALCVVVALPRIAWDIHVNGTPPQKSATVRAVMEQRAGTDFKPSVTALGKGYPTIALASRGTTLSQVMFAPNNWAWTSFMSAFGVYGYMAIFTPGIFYHVFAVLIIAVSFLALFALRRERPESWIALATTFILGSSLVIASSLLLSWTNQLQAQGRYLFPVLPIFSLVLGAAAPKLPVFPARLIIASMFMLSVASFLEYALPQLTAQ
jgi:hypothetical protein